MAYIVMTYIVVAYIVMAYIVMACVIDPPGLVARPTFPCVCLYIRVGTSLHACPHK